MFVFEYLIMDLCSLVGLKCENIGSESSDNLIKTETIKHLPPINILTFYYFNFKLGILWLKV